MTIRFFQILPLVQFATSMQQGTSASFGMGLVVVSNTNTLMEKVAEEIAGATTITMTRKELRISPCTFKFLTTQRSEINDNPPN